MASLTCKWSDGIIWWVVELKQFLHQSRAFVSACLKYKHLEDTKMYTLSCTFTPFTWLKMVASLFPPAGGRSHIFINLHLDYSSHSGRAFLNENPCAISRLRSQEMCQSEVYRVIHHGTFHPIVQDCWTSKFRPLGLFRLVLLYPFLWSITHCLASSSGVKEFISRTKTNKWSWPERKEVFFHNPFICRWWIVVTLLHGSIKKKSKKKKTIKGHLNPIVSPSRKPKVTMGLLIIRRADHFTSRQAGLTVLTVNCQVGST